MRFEFPRQSLLLLACVSAVFPLASRAAHPARGAADEPVTFYVSPAGNDSWSGKLADVKPDKSDGPFATVLRARDALRALRARDADRLKQSAAIYLRGGTYELPVPLVLAPEDSGTEAQPLMIAAYQGEHPVLSGGRRVVGWKVSNEGGHEVWTAKLPDGLPPNTVRQLWVDGRRRARSRHPAKGYFRVEKAEAAPGEKKEKKEDRKKGASEFHFRDGDLKAWPTVADAEVVLMSKWLESRLPVKSVDEKEHLATFSKHSMTEIDPGDAYYVEGAMDFLAESGQWCADPKSGTVRYLPLPGEKPESVEAVAPALEQVLRLEGRLESPGKAPQSPQSPPPSQGKFVDHIIFRGLTFAHTQSDLPDHDAKGNPGPSGFHQAAIGVPAAVFGQGVTHCTFDHCTVEHVGGYGLELAGGCQHDLLTRCIVTDLGAGGIKLGEQGMRADPAEQTFDNEISDCRITDGGLLFPSGVGIWIGQSYDDRLTHNEVADFYYTALSVGWRWGYARSLTRGIVVEHNDVHHIGVKTVKRVTGAAKGDNGANPDGGAGGDVSDGPILSDMGGIYTLGPQEGTVIRNNRFQHIAAIKYGGWGIYFDEGSTGIVAEKNLVYQTTHGGFHQHYGKDNVFRNNIIAFGRDWQIQRTRPEDHRSFTFERNLVFWDTGYAVAGNWSSFNAVFDHNVYWTLDKGEMKFAGMDWNHWREKGMDADSLQADPGFIDPIHGNFRLKDPESSSPVSKVGFESFDTDDVGPRK